VLGSHWAYHLLLVSVIYFAAAYRFDSRAVLTLALTSFAAWRGVSVAMPYDSSSDATGTVRLNALGCGLLFIAAGALLARARRKAHFEPVWVAMGAILLFGGILSGVLEKDAEWMIWELVLLVVGGTFLAACYRLRRPLEFALATAALYVGGFRLLVEVMPNDSGGATLFLIAIWSGAALIFLIATTRRMRRAE
jgi:hypothetical protein